MSTILSTINETDVREPIESVSTAAYTIPTDSPESDGTLEWDATTIITVSVHAGDEEGFGYTFAPAAAEAIIRDELVEIVMEHDAMNVEGCWQAMVSTIRNAGRPGVVSCAISAVDVALWDLKARLLGLPLVELWGSVRDAVPVYGSGGFTSYSDRQLEDQFSGWRKAGITRMKMKVGRDPEVDPHRVRVARRIIGEDAELFVDANGAYGRKQALRFAEQFSAESNIVWFEEPRPSDDLEGLRLIRDRGPSGMDITAGEYGYTPCYFRRMLEAGAVDCLQADVTRCGGFTGFLKVAALCESFNIPLSAHCAPQLHAHIGCATQPLRHIEYFHDHVRIGKLLFAGRLEPNDGCLRPDRTEPGHGIQLKHDAAEQFRVSV